MGTVPRLLPKYQTAILDRWPRIAGRLLLGRATPNQETGLTRIDAVPPARTDTEAESHPPCNFKVSKDRQLSRHHGRKSWQCMIDLSTSIGMDFLPILIDAARREAKKPTFGVVKIKIGCPQRRAWL